ncbi:hypothetical protein EAG21025_34900 [Enterobacter asburiae]|uniref:hypothetical protein n=1 Tax=Enterobacter asburiae TaxID=61645 RepID=UPI0034E855B6
MLTFQFGLISKKIKINENGTTSYFDFYQESERKKIVGILNDSIEKTNEEKLKLVEHISKGFVSNLGPALTVFVLGTTGAWFSLNALGVI